MLARSRIVVLISTLIFTWRLANQPQDVLTQLSAELDILSTSESGDTLAHRVRAFSVSRHPIQWPIAVSMITFKHHSWDNYCLVSVMVILPGGLISWGFVSQSTWWTRLKLQQYFSACINILFPNYQHCADISILTIPTCSSILLIPPAV